MAAFYRSRLLPVNVARLSSRRSSAAERQSVKRDYGVIGPSTQRACANCHVLHLASAHGSRAWVEVGMNVGDGFDANKGN